MSLLMLHICCMNSRDVHSFYQLIIRLGSYIMHVCLLNVPLCCRNTTMGKRQRSTLPLIITLVKKSRKWQSQVSSANIVFNKTIISSTVLRLFFKFVLIIKVHTFIISGLDIPQGFIHTHVTCGLQLTPCLQCDYRVS